MAHLYTSRRRTLSLFTEKTRGVSQYPWELANALLYNLGGLLFILGSIFFLPSLIEKTDAGAWIFIFGSVLYLLVTAQDLFEIQRSNADGSTAQERMEAVAAWFYLTATVLVLAGSVCFLSAIERKELAGLLFLIGSALFFVGGAVNIAQITRHHTTRVRRMMNLTALSFTAGALLFAVASVPYLWLKPGGINTEEIKAFLAWQFIVASGFFLIGGVTNQVRLHLRHVASADNSNDSGTATAARAA